MLLGNHTTATNTMGENDKFISELILQNRYYEAHLLLAGLKEDKAWVVYNRALTLIRIEKYEQAIDKLDIIQSLLPLAKMEAAEDDATRAFATEDAARDNHLLPIDNRYAATFPRIVKNNVLRLKIDCYAATGQWNKVTQTAAQLGSRRYGNVEKALAKAAAGQQDAPANLSPDNL